MEVFVIREFEKCSFSNFCPKEFDNNILAVPQQISRPQQGIRQLDTIVHLRQHSTFRLPSNRRPIKRRDKKKKKKEKLKEKNGKRKVKNKLLERRFVMNR